MLEGLSFPKVQASAENIRAAKFVVTKGCLDTLVDMIPLKKCQKWGNIPEKRKKAMGYTRMKAMGYTVEYKRVCFTKYLWTCIWGFISSYDLIYPRYIY